jgi:hypothetical protein
MLAFLLKQNYVRIIFYIYNKKKRVHLFIKKNKNVVYNPSLHLNPKKINKIKQHNLEYVFFLYFS